LLRKLPPLALPENRPQAVEQPLHRREPKQVRATVLFGDIVGSTERLAAMGDHKWMKVLDAYYAIIHKGFGTFQGIHLSTAGDGFLATFDHPVQAIQCAAAILESVKELGLRIRFGMHVGECLSVDEFVGGLTVHIGARIAAAADAGEVLVSDAVKSHLADSAIRFVDRGNHDLKGVPGRWRLFTAC
jgi:class 3 adenylate cyclase